MGGYCDTERVSKVNNKSQINLIRNKRKSGIIYYYPFNITKPRIEFRRRWEKDNRQCCHSCGAFQQFPPLPSAYLAEGSSFRWDIEWGHVKVNLVSSRGKFKFKVVLPFLPLWAPFIHPPLSLLWCLIAIIGVSAVGLNRKTVSEIMANGLRLREIGLRDTPMINGDNVKFGKFHSTINRTFALS